jgi:hypothetical protein
MPIFGCCSLFPGTYVNASKESSSVERQQVLCPMTFDDVGKVEPEMVRLIQDVTEASESLRHALEPPWHKVSQPGGVSDANVDAPADDKILKGFQVRPTLFTVILLHCEVFLSICLNACLPLPNKWCSLS